MKLKVMEIVIAIGLLIPRASFGQQKFDLYVSDGGNDINPGNSARLPKKTISAAAPFLKNQHTAGRAIVKLGLRSGDVFNDNLVTSYPIMVGTYSDNNKNDFAILNGSKEFSSGWVKSPGFENTFEQEIPYSGFVGYGIGGIGSYSYIYVTEINKTLEKSAPFSARKPLQFVSSLDALATTPGSFYSPINTNENPKKIFLHTSDDSSPNENAMYRYEVTVHDWAINSTYQSNNIFENLWVRGFGAGNGILPGGENSYYNKIVFGPGAGIHHLVVRGGTINHSLFLPGSKNTGDFAVVFYDVEGWQRHCKIENTMFLDISTPVYSHTSTGSNFGAVEMNNIVAFADMSTPGGFMFTSNNDTVLLNNIYADGFLAGYNYGSAKYASIANSYFNEVSFGIGFSRTNPVTAFVNNVFIKTKAYGEATGIYMQSNTSLTLSNSIIHVVNNSSRPAAFVYGSGAETASIKATGNIFICDIEPTRSINAAVSNIEKGTASSGDVWNNNVYILLRGKSITWSTINANNVGSGNIQNFEEWKKQSGHDRNSLFFDLRNDPRGLKAIFADPANGNYDLANTPEGHQIAALRAGMTTPLNCFVEKPTYEKAADLIRNNKIISVDACRNPCSQNTIKINADFNIQAIGDRQIKLEWIISEQQNINHYEIQRAAGNNNFVKIGALAVTPDSVHSFMDHIEPGVTCQYRLVIVARGLNKCFSEARSIKLSSDKAFSVYPNPSPGKIAVSMNGYVGKATIIITNALGRTVLKKETVSLYSTQYFNLISEPKGIYFMQVETNKGVDIQKFILQ